MDNNNSQSSGLGLTSVVFIVFLILKLCKVIDWSWWWVTSPLWISILLCITIAAIVAFIGLVVGIIKLFIK